MLAQEAHKEDRAWNEDQQAGDNQVDGLGWPNQINEKTASDRMKAM